MLEFGLAGNKPLFNRLNPVELVGQLPDGDLDASDALFKFDGFWNFSGDRARRTSAGLTAATHARDSVIRDLPYVTSNKGRASRAEVLK